MEESRFYNLQSTPHWIDNLLPRLQAANGELSSARETLNLAQSVINILLSAVAKYDAKFSFQPVNSSSFFTEKEPNHFELLIFLSPESLRPAEIHLQDNGCLQGLTLIEMVENTRTQNNWKSLCIKSTSEKEYLSSKMLRAELSSLLSKLLADMLYLQHYHDKTTQGIEVRNISSEDLVSLEIKIRGLTLIVDLLTAIDCEGVWPVHRNSSKDEKCVGKGNKHSTKRKTVNCGVQLVSKATTLEYHWRIWFCKAERFELNFSRFPQRRRCFQLLKTFVYNELDCGFFKPYHLQTVLLHESAKFSDSNQWTIEKLPLRFYGVLRLLESFARDKFCPHFFIPSLNLFAEISSHNLRVFCQKIKSVKETQSLREEENTWL
ncbi:protein mab-21-like 2 [Oculina patagonica]